MNSSHLAFFLNVQKVQLYSNTNMDKFWKNSRFILLERLDFHMVDNPPIAVHALPMSVLISIKVDEIWLPKYYEQYW